MKTKDKAREVKRKEWEAWAGFPNADLKPFHKHSFGCGYDRGYQAATEANKEALREVKRTFEYLLNDVKSLGVYSGDGFATEQKAIEQLKQLVGDE